jgi:site-specific recombinase XerD
MSVDFQALAQQVALAARGEGNPTRHDAIELEHLKLASPPDEVLYDICGRRRSPATLRSFRLGQKPGNFGKSYPATPPTETEFMRMLKACKNNPAGRRGRALMVLQYRSGLRISEALDLKRYDIKPDEGTVFVANGKGGKARLVGMDPWGFEQVMPWVDYRYDRYPDGPIFCVVQGPTKGLRWSPPAARTFVHKIAREAGIDHRVAPHQFRHGLAVGMAREQLQLYVVQRQLGHASMATTAAYLEGISNEEIVSAVGARPAPATELAA